MLCFMQEAQKDNPHLGQAHCLVNGENLVLHVVQDILVSYQRAKYLKYDHVRRKLYKNQFETGQHLLWCKNPAGIQTLVSRSE